MPVGLVGTEVINDVVRLAGRAPSLHNSQPWRWVADGSRLRLFLDPQRAVDSDRFGRQAHIGCGAVLDHFRMAIAVAGWRADIERFCDPSDSNQLASLEFSAQAVATEADRRCAEAIARRRTDRLPFLPPPAWESVEPTLRGAVDGGVTRLDVMAGDVYPQLVEASQLTEALRLYNSAYHGELDWWTTPFNLTQGIPPSSLVSAAESDRVDIARLFPVSGHTDRRLDVGQDHAKILVLSTPDDSPASALACGEVLSRVLLECTAAGLATCPITHVTEVQASRDIVRGLLDQPGEPQVLVRVGIAPPTVEVPATPRRPLEDVLQWRP